MPVAPIICRFAPSPNGPLHLGHAYSALRNQAAAAAAGGHLLLRMEDIDVERCSPAFEAAIRDDLDWLGLRWRGPVRRQSEHVALYGLALDRLAARHLLYPCFCTRGEIAAATTARAGWPRDPDGAPLYPGLCRGLDPVAVARRMEAGRPFGLRLDMARAMAMIAAPLRAPTEISASTRMLSPEGKTDPIDAFISVGTLSRLSWDRPRTSAPLCLEETSAPLCLEEEQNPAGRPAGFCLGWSEFDEGHTAVRVDAAPQAWGDAVLRRKDIPASYHIAVVVDDAAQGVTDVVRGRDLFAATGLHRLLQVLLALPEPRYHHHRLVLDEAGLKLSKSRMSLPLSRLRRDGVSPQDIARLIADRLEPCGG